MIRFSRTPLRHLVVGLSIAWGCTPAIAQTMAFRGFWVDAFKQGFHSTAEIDELVSHAVRGNYNAILAEVLAFQDNEGDGHGAYWNSGIVPKAADIDPALDDPLAYLIERAHAHGIEVHAWLVAFRISSAWPPSGNTILSAHPEWIMVPEADMGAGPAPVGVYYVLDPGCPEVQNYLISIVRELCTDYEIDGIHWDYIRYTQTDAGYPADTSYDGSGLVRFQRLTGYSETPPPTGEPAWDHFRRRTINELVRRARFEIASIRNPRQPLRHTAALVSWGNAPVRFSETSAYSLFQDWNLWLRQGWLDAGCPMLYYREHRETHARWYRNWVDASLWWRHDRHLFVGQAPYLNTMENSVTQMQYAYDQGADGTVSFSYCATADENLDGIWENDWSWYDYVADSLFATPTALPTMPWRNPATATEGTLYGRITDAETNGPVDDATVEITGLSPVQTDGNGYYVMTMLPAVAAGTTYDVTVRHPNYRTETRGGAVVAGDIANLDIALEAITPEDLDGDDADDIEQDDEDEPTAPVLPQPIELLVSGPTQVGAGGTIVLLAKLEYDDGSVAEVSDQVSWRVLDADYPVEQGVLSMAAAISPDGLLTPRDRFGEETPVNVVAHYAHSGADLQGSHTVTILPGKPTPGLLIPGRGASRTVGPCGIGIGMFMTVSLFAISALRLPRRNAQHRRL